MEWKTIDSAPTEDENTPFLVCDQNFVWIAEYWYEDDGVFNFGTHGLPTMGATHWMPLPTPQQDLPK